MPCNPRVLLQEIAVTIPRQHEGRLTIELNVPVPCPEGFTIFGKSLIATASAQGAGTMPDPTSCPGPLSGLASSDVISHPRDRTKPGFLKLPPEIRDMIYAELLVRTDDTTTAITPWRNGFFFCTSAQFLRTCKQIYREGIKWLYSENRIHLDEDDTRVGGFFGSPWFELG